MNISARFTSADQGVISLDGVDHYGPIPPNAGDLREIFEAWTGAGNTPAPYVPPPEVMPDLSDRQFFQGLAEEGVITWEEAEAAVGPGTIPAQLAAILTAQISDPQQLARARVKVMGATLYRFSDPLVPMVRGAMGWSEERLKDFWRSCAALT